MALTKEQVEEFRNKINKHPDLTLGQKNQCYRFLDNYSSKESIGLCERYIAVVTGKLVVKQQNPESKSGMVQNLLMMRPGLTRNEILQATGLSSAKLSDILSKGFKKGIFTRLADNFYAN